MENREIEGLEKKMKDGIVEITYRNKSGERLHTVKATTTPIHLMFRPKPHNEYLTFYDMEAEVWRRCSKANVIKTGRFWPWEEEMKIYLDPVWVNVVEHATPEEKVLKTESRFVKFFERVWSALRDVIKRPEPQPEYKIYMPGEPLPYNEAEIEDAECEIL